MDVPEPVLTISIFCWHSVVIHRWVGRWGGRHRDTETKGTQRNRESDREMETGTERHKSRNTVMAKETSNRDKETE